MRSFIVTWANRPRILAIWHRSAPPSRGDALQYQPSNPYWPSLAVCRTIARRHPCSCARQQIRGKICRHFVTTCSKQTRGMHTQARKRWRRAHPKEAALATASFASRGSAKLIKAHETFISPSFPFSLLRLTVVATTVPNLEKSACRNVEIVNEGKSRPEKARKKQLGLVFAAS